MEVLIAEPVVWEIEYRCFALDGSVVATSVYSRFGELAEDIDGSYAADEEETRAAAQFAAEVLLTPGTPLPRAVVVDVGRIADRGWAVVEANAAWGAGIYGGAPAALLPVIAAACVGL
jgi:hypothetical protein